MEHVFSFSFTGTPWFCFYPPLCWWCYLSRPDCKWLLSKITNLWQHFTMMKNFLQNFSVGKVTSHFEITGTIATHLLSIPLWHSSLCRESPFAWKLYDLPPWFLLLQKAKTCVKKKKERQLRFYLDFWNCPIALQLEHCFVCSEKNVKKVLSENFPCMSTLWGKLPLLSVHSANYVLW